MIKCNQPVVTEEDIAAVSEAMKNHLAQGPKVEELEQEICNYINVPHCVAFSSATAAFDSLWEYVLEEGDEVIISPLTFHSVIYGILRAGGKPVFIDCEDSLMSHEPDYERLSRYVTDKTKFIVPTYLFGCPDPMITLILERYPNIKVIEDAAQSLGAEYYGQRVGSMEGVYATIFSLYATKNVTGAEGGLLVTHDKGLNAAMRNLRNCGIAQRGFEKGNIETVLGTNRRMSDVHAALALSQLKRIDQIIDGRLLQTKRIIATLYGEDFQEIEGFRSTFHHFPIFTCCSEYREELIKKGKANNIEFGTYYRYLANYDRLIGEFNETPNLLKLSGQILQIPIGESVSHRDLGYILEFMMENGNEHAAKHSV